MHYSPNCPLTGLLNLIIKEHYDFKCFFNSISNPYVWAGDDGFDFLSPFLFENNYLWSIWEYPWLWADDFNNLIIQSLQFKKFTPRKERQWPGGQSSICKLFTVRQIDYKSNATSWKAMKLMLIWFRSWWIFQVWRHNCAQ